MKRLRWHLTPLLAATVLFAQQAQPPLITGTIHSGLPPVTVTAHTGRPLDGEGWNGIDRVDVRFGDTSTQTISFPDKDSQPAYENGNSDWVFTLQDVDCDGYKDLLISETPGIHGDAVMHLYRFDLAQQGFVEYPKFAKLFAFKSVDCRTKTIKTYSNDGDAGCAYSSGTYQWIHGELLPVRIEEQENLPLGSDRFVRFIHRWNGMKQLPTIKRLISDADCHTP